MKKLTLITIGVVGLLIAGNLLVGPPLGNRVKVSNESGQTVQILTIVVGGDTIRMGNIPSGKSQTAKFKIRSDDSFAVKVELADESKIIQNCGYVTNGMYGHQAEIVILPGGRLECKQWE